MKKIVLAFMMLFAITGVSFAQADLQPVATVKLNKSETITLKQLKARSEMYEKQMGKKLTVDERKKVLEAYIDEKLVLQAAAKAGLSIPDSTIDQYFLQGMSQQIGIQVATEKDLEDLIKQAQGVNLDTLLKAQIGLSKAEYKSYLRNQLIMQQYVVSQRQAELQAVAPTDEEIRAFYESNKASLVWTDMMKLFVILVPKTGNNEAAKLKANDLRNKYLDKKLTVDQIAVQSRTADSGYQAGEMLIQKNEASAANIGMELQELLKLFGRDEGFTTDICETDVDYRVLSIRKKYNAKMLAISDVVQPETTMTVYEYIRQNLTNQKQSIYIQAAATEIANSLNTETNVEMKKSGAALDKLLDWGE